MLHHPANTNPLANVHSEQPDKVLFDAAMADMDKGKYTVARLDLETLLNTYPDSEYLARAKMGIADSWYREGGIEGMAQAEAQYKDFITFFPAMKEASEAQLKVATIHYRQLQKPDRDPTEADRAQAELRTFLINYPDSPLRPQALQMLRDTQEVLAERAYRIGDFYLERAKQGEYPDYRPAQSRLEEVLAKYPLYSRGDEVLDDLANSYLTTAQLYAGAAKIENVPQDKALYKANQDADQAKAVADFDRLIERYPLSPDAQDARRKLTALKLPVPTPTQEAIAFNRQEIAGRTAATAKKESLMQRLDPAKLVSSRPAQELARADRVGEPSLAEPPQAAPEPPPGLDALLHASMVATGAIPAGPPNASLSASLTGAGTATTAGSGGGSNSATASVAAAPSAAAPLMFQNVPQSRGADTPDTGTPQAVTGSNDNDPNARQAVSPDNPNVILTPDEIDLQNREQILAEDVHRQVPAPYADLVKAARQAAAAQAKVIAKYRQQIAAQKPGGKSAAANPPASPATPVAAPAKKSFFHIW